MCLWVKFVAAAIAASAAHKQANTQNAISEYQGRVAENNAQMARWQAADAKSRGDLAVSKNRQNYLALAGTQQATLAARGMDTGYGSPNAILSDTDYFGAYDEKLLRDNSRREAWAFGVQADNYENEAQFLYDQRKANNPFVAGAFAFAGSLFGGGGLQQGQGANTYNYRGTDLPNSLRGQNNYEGTLMTDSGMVASRWYGKGSGYGDFAADYYGSW